jgi:CDP-glycerol glycerophosphotransferase
MPDFDSYKDVLRGFYLDVPDDLPNDICQTEDDLLLQSLLALIMLNV